MILLLLLIVPDYENILHKKYKPQLIQETEEHDVISEAGDSVRCGHLNYECEHIVYKRIERLQIKKKTI